MSLLENLHWRYAAKRYTDQKISAEDLDTILEAARLSPSAFGMQPYKIFVISNRELLEQIKPIANHQPAITECSHLLVYASWDEYTEERLNTTFRQLEKERGMPAMKMEDYKNRILNTYTPLGELFQTNHAARQAYIALAVALVQAAELKIDSTPMEGFVKEELDQLLDLERQGLKSQVLLALGYRDANNDWNSKMPKYRRSREEIIVDMK